MMAMIYTKEFWAIYGIGARVYDATGRRMRHVIACNPETGESIVFAQSRVSPLDLLRRGLRAANPLWGGEWIHRRELSTRHGFWPAPLQVVMPEGEA